MKKVSVLLALLLLSSTASASYTAIGFSLITLQAVQTKIAELSNQEFATNPWPNYSIQSITLKAFATYEVQVVDVTTNEQKSYEFTVTEDQCELSVCSWTAELTGSN